ncbi:MAG: glycosyltransferase family 4 protein [Thermodesulfovibrionaceae bacterium]
MKIAIVRKKYTFHGGAESYINELIKFLISQGHEVLIYSINWQKPQEQSLPITFKKIPVLSFNSFFRDLTFAVFGYFILKKERKNIDIIQSHDKFLIQDLYRAGDGCHIQWLKERWKRVGIFKKLSIAMNPYHWLILALEKAIFKGKRYKKIIAISELVRNNIINNYKVNPDDIIVIYNCIDYNRFASQNKPINRKEIRESFGIDENDFVVLFVGSGFERKGVKYLIEAAEKVKYPLTVLIVGKGDSKKYKKYIKRQKIVFCGPQRKIEKFYSASDLFVFPTIYEPFGLVVLEAMAAGLPVITTKLSGASEIILNGENGFVVDRPEDTDKIADYIDILIENRELYSHISKKAQTTASQFTMDKILQEIDKLYSSIIRS